ncbi:relaxase [Arthrobacter sp. Soil782]|uniref:relaxase/mobilization nuclease domain-containing protein n=1 Tax=Arthrobacter sp. Soil782 TaxID=1736410 RepID=UPI0006FF556E|nr:relaxase/mobilization nuclease domain-containing protein [Arthrobacter sp. Soil782]KRF08948.1 relaxase [Arthrobacter sp. Soil782]
MIPNVSRGDRMTGLMVYLAGPGRANEHTEPHLVAGSAPIMAWHDDAELNRDAAVAIGHELDQAKRFLKVDVPGGHVWHCSLSLRAEEGDLSDEKWADIAHDFMDEMGFTEASGKAPASWVAVRHGHSKAGNDHIHIAASMVREDGTKWSPHNDFRKSQESCRTLEKKYGLEQISGVHVSRGIKRGEREAAQRRGYAEPERLSLSRKVRGCAVASQDEAEFVRRMRRTGALIRPRFAAGRDDVITGYRVAERPVKGQRPIWYSGTRLGSDLTLPKLRSGWEDSPQAASEAAQEWTAASRGRRVVSAGRELNEPDPQMWQRYSDELSELNKSLAAVPVEDHATWAHVARETSGAFAAWSNSVEAAPGALAATADRLSKTAQLRQYPVRPQRTVGPSAMGAAKILMTATSSNQTAAQAMMLVQLANLAKSIHDMHKAAGDVRAAQQINTVVRERLRTVAVALNPEPATTLQTATAQSPTGPVQGPAVDAETALAAALAARDHGTPQRGGSVLPPKIEPARKPTLTTPKHDRGIER